MTTATASPAVIEQRQSPRPHFAVTLAGRPTINLYPHDPDTWYADSRTRKGVQYRIENATGFGWDCHCPARIRECAHILALMALFDQWGPPDMRPETDDWNDIAPAAVVAEPPAPPKPPAPVVRFPQPPKGKPLAGFVKATKEQSKLRMALIGPSGSGKTYTALAIAKGLDLGKIAFIDTERGSASKYAHEFDFDVLTLDPPFTIDKYIEAIRMAGDAGYGVLIIDSLSHAWAGAGGMLEYVDNRKKQSGGKDGFSAWGDATPKQNHFIDAILGSACHVIATMRSKMTYVQGKDERTGKGIIEKLGLQPIQRDGVEYEFDIIGDLDEHNTLRVTKTRASNLNGYVVEKAGAELAGMIRTWLLDGAPATPDAPADTAWAWMGEYISEMKLAGIKKQSLVAEFLNCPFDDLYMSIDVWLRSGDGRAPKALVSAVADWLAAGKPKPAPAPATEPAMFDEAEYTEVPA